jgi:hypothetical protein
MVGIPTASDTWVANVEKISRSEGLDVTVTKNDIPSPAVSLLHPCRVLIRARQGLPSSNRKLVIAI